MERWERVLTVVTALAAIVCTSAVGFAGARLLECQWVARKEAFSWSNGIYQVRGRFDAGVLEELRILRMDLEE